MAKLTRTDVSCAMALQDKGQSVRGIARQLGVAESTLRERLEREACGAVDARQICETHPGYGTEFQLDGV